MGRNIVFFFILSFLFLGRWLESASWEIVHQSRDYFSKIKNHNYVIFIFINSEKCQNCQDIIINKLKKLEEHSIVLDNKIDLNILDYSKNVFFKNHHDFRNESHFFLCIKNKIFELFEFEEFLHTDELYIKTIDFLEDKIGGIIKHLSNLQQTEIQLNEFKKIGIYLGKKNNNFKSFKELANNYLDFNFYYSNDEIFKSKLLLNYGSKIALKEDVFIILKHRNLKTKFDPKKLTIFKNFQKKNLKRFFLLEKNEKLQNCTKKLSVVKELFQENIKIILYVTDFPLNELKNKAFEEFVEKAPKEFVFVRCGIRDLHMNKILNLFVISQNHILPQNIHLLYLSRASVQVRYYKDEFEVDKIMGFFRNFYRSNSYLFEMPIQEFESESFKNKDL